MKRLWPLLLLFACPAWAEVQYALPLEGWCRPGQCFPVQIVSFNPGDELRLPGCTPVSVAAKGIVPVLLLENHADPPLRLADENWQPAVPMVGPSQLIDEDAYLPALAWQPGLPLGTRQRLVLAGAIFSILLLGLSLLKWRPSVLLMAAISLLFCAFIVLFHHKMSGIYKVSGGILVESEGNRRLDHWTYYAAVGARDLRLQCTGPSHPVFATLEQARALRPRIVQNADGSWQMEVTLQRGRKCAALDSRLEPAPTVLAPLDRNLTSPLVPLARAQLKKGQSIKGQTTAGPENAWPTVVIGSD